ncbi:phage holin [Enterovibrio norvegicus]|uniref:phage holin n=1 Tax=Enterovibrio norvegicus TaxID=188144 RepID=UPI003899FB15
MNESASAISYSASAVTTMAGLTFNEWVALGGFLIGVATFAVNWWYKHAQTKIMQDKQDQD